METGLPKILAEKNMNPRCAVCVGTWNGARYILGCLKSIYAQDYADFRVYLIDNGSTDDTVSLVKEHYPQVAVIQNFKNLGFAKVYNQLIDFSSAPFVFLVNQDVILTPNVLSKLMQEIETDENVACVGPKLLKVHHPEDSLDDPIFTTIIDSTGLRVSRSRCFVDRGSGEGDHEQYDEQREVFGLAGACLLLRRNSLEAVKFNLPTKYIFEYLDESFFACKEDVDLAWRLRLRGFSARFVPEAIAYHYRGFSGNTALGRWQIIKNRFIKSSFSNRYSYHNHLALLFKNLTWGELFWDWPFILFYETQKVVYSLVAEWGTIKMFFVFLINIPFYYQKRKIIQNSRKVSLGELRKWFLR